MKIIFTIIGLISAWSAFAQFAIIYDKEGNCNVRSSPEIHNNIIGKLNNGHFVYILENSGNWTNVNYSKDSKDVNGYVYKDRLILVSSYTNLPMLTKTDSLVVLGKDGVKILITIQNFDSGKHAFTFSPERKDQIQLIDNKPYWGTDGGLPKTEYKSIEVYIGYTSLALPNSALLGLYQVSLDSSQVHYDKKNDTIYIQSMNSDGAGGYGVIWKVAKGVFKGRYVFSDF
ncbi:MAG TPA: SH3 domain-containing protein [Saprospiraceae bacterium]|nr:SH3 domain-containing protein [Saprospiraceae bacterium]